jgi:tetratricopeptide (TPR) repeat protein
MGLSLRGHIIGKIIMPSAIILLAIGIVTLAIMWPNAKSWSNTVQINMVAEEQKNLEFRTYNLKELARKIFTHIESDVIILKEYANSIYDNSFNIVNYYPSFFGVSSVDPTLPPGGLTNGNNIDYSGWYNNFNSNPNTETNLNSSSIMDNVWRALFRSNLNYASLYIGYEDSLFRNFPYQRLDGFPTLSYTCLSNNLPTIGYDPKCRSWYQNSKTNKTKVIFTEPYNDASTGNVLISASHAIQDIGNTFLGVVSIDIVMQTLESAITGETILENGYSYMIDITGNSIVYPELPRDRVYKIWENEFTDTTEANAFQITVFPNMTANQVGQQEFTKNGSPWLITYSNVNDTNYMVAMVVPNSDITRATDNIESSINNSLIGAVVAMTVVIILVIILFFVIMIKLADSITEPVQHINEKLNRIADGDLTVEMVDMNSNIREVNNLIGDFQQLVAVLRSANNAFLKNNIQNALECYNEVEVLMKEIGNNVGLGVIQINKAYSLMELTKIQDNLEKSEEYFELAISNATNMMQKEVSKQDNNGKIFFKSKLADRHMGLGLLYVKKGEYQKAFNEYDRSLELHSECDNILGRVRTLGNKGQLYREIGEDGNAGNCFDQAHRIAEEKWQVEPNEENSIAMQYSLLNMGLYCKDIGNYDEAGRLLNSALSLRETIDKHFQLVCLSNLAFINEKLGNKELADQIKKDFALGGSIHAIFCLDISGSMAGQRITICRENINDILSEYLKPSDNASLITFHSRCKWVFKNESIGDNLLELKGKVNRGTNTGGRTAFYDAVYQASKHLVEENDMENGSQWIIALTDGQDNESKVKLKTLREYVGKYNLNIIIIGALLEQRELDTIHTISSASENGIFIAATNIEGISDAFKSVGEIISRGQFALETL